MPHTNVKIPRKAWEGACKAWAETPNKRIILDDALVAAMQGLFNHWPGMKIEDGQIILPIEEPLS